VQNKGGGHDEIGYNLALSLQAQGLKVTLLQDAAEMSNLPYSLYDAKLPQTNIVLLDPADEAAYAEKVTESVKGGPPVTHIFDNLSRGPADVAPLLALAKASPDFKLYSFVSHVETGAVKPNSGQRLVEKELEEELPGKWASFRPQYIYGPSTDKRGYLDRFWERAAMKLPSHGASGKDAQHAKLAHCEDVAELLSSVVGKEEEAGGEVFNCGTADQVTYRAVCEAAGNAAGKEVKIVGLPAGTKTSFPFRPNAEGF
jgi:nucleoside-diphosphate-sugar epimerase